MQFVTAPSVFCSAAVPLLDVCIGGDDGFVYAKFQTDTDNFQFTDWMPVAGKLPGLETDITDGDVQALSSVWGTYVFVITQVSRPYSSTISAVFWTMCAHQVCTDWKQLGSGLDVMVDNRVSVLFNEAMNRTEVYVTTTEGIQNINQVGSGFEADWAVVSNSNTLALTPYPPTVISFLHTGMTQMVIQTTDSKLLYTEQMSCSTTECKWSAVIPWLDTNPGNPAVVRPLQIGINGEGDTMIFTVDLDLLGVSTAVQSGGKVWSPEWTYLGPLPAHSGSNPSSGMLCTQGGLYQSLDGQGWRYFVVGTNGQITYAYNDDT